MKEANRGGGDAGSAVPGGGGSAPGTANARVRRTMDVLSGLLAAMSLVLLAATGCAGELGDDPDDPVNPDDPMMPPDTDPPDVGDPPDPIDPVTPPRSYDPATTVTIHLHGWTLDGSVEEGTPGVDEGGGPIVDGLQQFAGLPHAEDDPSPPNLIVGTSYYGDTYPDYYTAADVAEVDAVTATYGGGVPRYGLIAAKKVREVLARTGATAFNLTCHSMGCEVSRYLIEHDLESLVSDELLARWVSFSGVVAGADMAATFVGLGSLAEAAGWNLIDVEHMTYSWFEQNVAVFDHERLLGNNPGFAGVIIQHIVGTRPDFEEAPGIPLLDLWNSDAANDGIMLSNDMYLHDQAPAARFEAPSGALLPSGAAFVHTDHFGVRESERAAVVGAAALVGSRRVTVTVTSITLHDDHEQDNPLDLTETGTGDAEVVIEAELRSPHVAATFGINPKLTELDMDHRNAPLYVMAEGATLPTAEVIVDMVVFDEELELDLVLEALEADHYPAYGVEEWLLSPSSSLGEVNLVVPLVAGTITAPLGDATLELAVAVEPLY